ncbi:hypothetical protein C0995_008197 [Termitomyces sp. Mi166|nr:hypothetical protein C0995_008197 [Termitomyces sp. Mi166\
MAISSSSVSSRHTGNGAACASLSKCRVPKQGHLAPRCASAWADVRKLRANVISGTLALRRNVNDLEVFGSVKKSVLQVDVAEAGNVTVKSGDGARDFGSPGVLYDSLCGPPGVGFGWGIEPFEGDISSLTRLRLFRIIIVVAFRPPQKTL